MKKIFRKVKYSYLVERIRALFLFGLIYNRKNRVFVQDTPGKGKGLFAGQAFGANSIAFVATGSCKIRHFEGMDCYKYPNWYGVDRDTWIDILDPYVKINHSCKPNLGIFSSRCFIALRDISEGEELTFDYSTTDDEPQWIMGVNGPDECACGESVCRKYIGPIQNLPQSYIDHVYPYLPRYFIKKYVQNKSKSTGVTGAYTHKLPKYTNTN